MTTFSLGLILLSYLSLCSALGYRIVEDFSGATFFDHWDFYGKWDDLTFGDVWWLGRQDATNQALAFVNANGNAVIKVDNSSNVPWNEKRNSVRITSQAEYGFGSLWIADVLHLPFGCSVWPAIWTTGKDWPNNGEIDIVEAINLMDQNQMTLHTRPGCVHATSPNQRDISGMSDCSQPSGCSVAETKPGSFGADFAANRGGVFAAQLDTTGILIWFWPRDAIPLSISSPNATSFVNTMDWGSPSASYPSTDACNIPQFFGPQKLVIDITLCGAWAASPDVYGHHCANSGPTGICYNDNVVGPGYRYDDAYFEISPRTYALDELPDSTATPGA